MAGATLLGATFADEHSLRVAAVVAQNLWWPLLRLELLRRRLPRNRAAKIEDA